MTWLGNAHEGHGASARWSMVFRDVPDHHDAPSTRYYRECEELLFSKYFGDLAGKRILKTDLWDEARNTRILLWAANRGACAYGVDIAPETAREALGVFKASRVTSRFAVADTRHLPFQADAFDAVYSMGTVEHFPQTAEAIAEVFRVLRPGGIAIVGVPNKLDPFLRPALVTVLNWLRLYPYGYETSYTATALASMLAKAGFSVRDVTGLLFMPGALRLLDLLLYCLWPPLATITDWAVQPFSFLYRQVPGLRRHGYLVACIAEKPL
ncbi:MAG TPA: class I SAM-dependent methyltransferase [Dehalococcoidia bacterium]|nr:class I SAM-dependent methyltransferase [Dehalococcoidia bacterium]